MRVRKEGRWVRRVGWSEEETKEDRKRKAEQKGELGRWVRIAQYVMIAELCDSTV